MARIELTDATLTFALRETRNVTLKQYLVKGMFLGSRNPRVTVRALDHINLTAKDGERIGIIGHNGAGKSTLLKLIAGVFPPTSGQRQVDGRICSLFDISLGFEFEASGWDNIRYRSYLQGETPKTLEGKIREIAEFSELDERFLRMPVRYYSAGMMVRLAFAIATSVEPEVLLIDEVLGVGDHAFQAKALARMNELMSRSRLMVLVSHDMTSVSRMCNRAVWLQHGKVMDDGPPDAVVAKYLKSIAPVGESHPVGGMIEQEAGPAGSVETSPPSEPVSVSEPASV
jgi:ABC-type polysaccharide/polyol phosphate transport system ATPase subunit